MDIPYEAKIVLWTILYLLVSGGIAVVAGKCIHHGTKLEDEE